MITLDGALSWLNLHSDKTTYLCASSRYMMNDLANAISDGDPAEAWNITDRLKSVGESIGNCIECAEIRVRCAHAVYRLANYQSVIDLLNEAIKMYPPDEHHNIAVAKWMQGYVYWKMRDKSDHARVSWQQSKESFESLGRMYLEGRKESWYQTQIGFMRNAIAIGNIMDGWIVRDLNGSWNLLRLDERGFLTRTSNSVLVDRLLLNDKPYQFEALREIDETLLADVSQQYVVQVNNNQMDKARIQNGAYVACSNNTGSVETGDIALVELVGTPSIYILRRFVRDNGNIVFRALSNNYYRDIVLPDRSANYALRGIALGQLTPLELKE